MSEAENSFRQQFLNWTNRASEAQQTAMPVLGEWSDYVKSGASNLYQTLPSYNGEVAPQQEPSWFQLSRVEKLIGFFACLGASILCFIICFFLFPVLALKPRKFAAIWSFGSILFVVSFGVLQGPYSYTRHLLSRDRIIFTGIFFGSVLSTLYFLLVVKSTIMTLLSSILEIFAVLYYSMSYFPFGALAVTWFSSYIVGYVGGMVGGLL